MNSIQELCAYGCGGIARYRVTKAARPCCSATFNKCASVKERNSEGLKQSYAQGRVSFFATTQSAVGRAWAKGKTAVEDSRIRSKISKGLFGPDDNSQSANVALRRKRILIKERGHCCESCKLCKWLGKDITLELDHRDGVRTHNARKNLALLCPNCHSQTPTWRRNHRLQKWNDDEMTKAIVHSSCISEVLKALDMRQGSAQTVSRFMVIHNLDFGKSRRKIEASNSNKAASNIVIPVQAIKNQLKTDFCRQCLV